jgi:hypothetical protein
VKNSRQAVKLIRWEPESPIRVNKRGQLFIRAHNKPLSIAATSVNNPDRSAFAVERQT